MLPHHRFAGDDKVVGKGLLPLVEVKTHHGVTVRSASTLSLLVVLFLAFQQSAQACVFCSFAITWYAFPPVFPWALIMSAWYFGYSLVVTMDGGTLLYIRRLPGSLAWFAPALLFAAFAFGPVVMFIFGILCLINFMVSLWPYPLLGWSRWLRWQIRVIGIIFIVALGYTAMTEYAAFRKMDQADIILKWHGDGLSFQMLQNLKEQEPASIPLYRKIVREGESFTRARAARRLGEVGNREEDVPILIEALANESRLESEVHQYAARDISASLQELTGIDLPREAPAEVWREKWEALQDKQTASEAENQLQSQ